MQRDQVIADRDAERALIGLILLDGGQFDRASLLVKESDFFYENHRVIWQAFTKCGQMIDSMSVVKALKAEKNLKASGGAAYLSELTMETPPASSLDFYSNSIQQISAMRSLDETTRKISHEIRENPHIGENITSLIDGWQEDIMRATEPLLRQANKTKGIQTIGQAFAEVYQSIDDIEQGNIPEPSTITTTFEQLDLKVEFQRGVVSTIAARPGVGKTSFADTLFLNYCALGLKPHFVCLEDTTRQQVMRMLSHNSEFDNRRIRDLLNGLQGKRASEDRDCLAGVAISMAGLNGTIDDTAGLTVESIRLRARKLVKQGCRIIIIDHALRISRPRWCKDARQAIDHILSQLNEMAKELDIPVVLFTQLRRSGSTTRAPSYDALKESGKFEEDSRVILLLHRVVPEDSDPSLPHAGLVIIAKANHDSGGRVSLIFDPLKCQWRNPVTVDELSDCRRTERGLDVDR